MVPTLFFYQLGLVALGCVFLLLCWLWPNAAASPRQPIGHTCRGLLRQRYGAALAWRCRPRAQRGGRRPWRTPERCPRDP